MMTAFFATRNIKRQPFFAGCLFSIAHNLSVIVILLIVILVVVIVVLLIVVLVILVVLVVIVIIVIHEIHLLIVSSIVCLLLGKLYF